MLFFILVISGRLHRENMKDLGAFDEHEKSRDFTLLHYINSPETMHIYMQKITNIQIT